MNGGSFENALERIEAAMARIERAAGRTSQSEQELAERNLAEQKLAELEHAGQELAGRHERLRAAVGQSLRQLDELIAEQTR